MTNSFDKDRARKAFRKMSCTDRLHRSVVEKYVDSLGLHRSQHMVIMFLSRQGEVCTSQKNIAEHFQISPAAVAVTLKKLEDGGYIIRESSDSDSRFNFIRLTDKGKSIVEKSESLFENTDYKMFSKFTDEDYDAFERCLDKIAEGLKELSEK